jgi:hypothetical protein
MRLCWIQGYGGAAARDAPITPLRLRGRAADALELRRAEAAIEGLASSIGILLPSNAAGTLFLDPCDLITI